ncbi:DNA-binding transcriptional activator of the SARP family [Streptomyces sp. 2224.1]|uniref:type VII secretion system-associated protein n=1 Tax=unclassified Streptomyces TaxID=2593676 RepID=UPI00087F9126|nr:MULTISPECIES: type VII secretion system-associated protein [unclassified Streptomyces]PBC81413.1 DNA-binding SARP family transcriptional activator [Streptomyces sp. 2321.6]SDR55134.1 DNA-binding transcriptional activator of the SARP family [Streptomyces sp. KS_16]SEC14196.1 DNA-binding transcriptional activator of the SARP family [Streptomyces sp. 2133.1]SED16789.1 DNA-binding transcriptional activator of the SARP family [Streptomyces sp. 2224.1]SEF08076.1 DNA-binding transcriptional activa
MTTPAGPAPAIPPVTEALRAQAAQQRGGYVYAIDPYFDPNGAVPPYGIVGGWSVGSAGQLVSFTHNQNYRPSPTALEFPPPVTALDQALQRAVTGYGSEQELLAAFHDATLILFSQEGQTGLYTVVEDDGSRYIPAFTHPTHTPDAWHQWQQATGRHLAATGLPVRLNPGHRISLTIPGAAGNQAGGEKAGPNSSPSASPSGLPEALVDAPLLAAGLLAALGRRRRTALWQSAMGAKGRRTPELRRPTGGAADTQDALLVGADPQAVRDLDHALRGLASALSVESRTLPTVYGAWLTDSELSLQLAHPAGKAPAPWQLGQNETIWRIQRADIPVHETDTGTAAPYPGLVSLGSLDGARLLLNLEAAPGLVSLTGTHADQSAVLTSVAAELATSGWSDRMTVTLVGFGKELTTLDPTRVRHFDDVEALMETMEAETRQRRGALAMAGHDSVQQPPWAPHLVLLAAQPTEEQAAKFAELVADSGRLGISYLAATEENGLPGATWKLGITPEGRLLAPLLGLELQAQLLPRAQYDAVVQLFAGATPDDDRDSDPSTPQFMVDITPSGRPAVYARLVGTYEITGLDAPDAEHGPLLHEALAMLLLHREGVHPRVLAAGLWPRGVTEEVRDALVERLRTWLGSDPDGTPRLGTDTTGRLTLAPSVVSDLDVLRTLHYEATAGSGASNARLRERLLNDALALAHGPLLANRPQGRYTWLSHEISEARLPLLVADVALALSAHHLEAGNPAPALKALNAALTTTPTDERLWNELLRAAHATGDAAELEATAASLLARHHEHSGGARSLPPRTEALLDELLPSWRDARSAAD